MNGKNRWFLEVHNVTRVGEESETFLVDGATSEILLVGKTFQKLTKQNLHEDKLHT